MAGLGRKTFASGEVLTAANTQGYLMDQSVMVFADEAARTSAIAAPAEGMHSYLSDTDSTEVYDGSAWAAVGGKILQVVQATTTTSTAIASGTYTDTTLSGTITPSAATSKILILLAQPLASYRGDVNIFTSLQLLRDATVIVALGDSIGQQSTGASSVQHSAISSMTYLDSPNTTSAITYKTQAKVNSTVSGGSATFQSGSAPSYIILIEVEA